MYDYLFLYCLSSVKVEEYFFKVNTSTGKTSSVITQYTFGNNLLLDLTANSFEWKYKERRYLLFNYTII